MINSDSIIKELESGLMTFGQDKKSQNIGRVIKYTDGVVEAWGLSKGHMGEIVEFSDKTTGVILNLSEDTTSIILLGTGARIKEGDLVKTTGKLLSIVCSHELLGRVINPIGAPLDGKARVKKGKPMPLERIAPGIVEREPVHTPLKTGIKAIDAMIPIGRGQRELIVGDRQTGKTTIAIDTILNQNQKRRGEAGKQVYCIYVAIGQKQSTVAQVIDRLTHEGAMNYSVVVAASASDPAALQYLAPYAGCAIAEYLLEKGHDVLIVYDDLTKHAWAYRQISLVLRRPAGREAYPGDVFYLHSRLLERAVKLNKARGGGSITALPIIETQANDISAYIPTNVISITDGQLFLQSDLFNAGIRPAINVGQSVSRVGNAAQTAAIKSVSGKMRLDLAQYRELFAFSQFGSELDRETLKQLERGKRLTEILKQPPYHPLPEALEVLSIYLVVNGLMDDVPIDSFLRFEEEFHAFVQKKHPTIIESLATAQKPNEEVQSQIQKAVMEFKKLFGV